MQELSFRARKILYALVTEYVATGEPVGSRKLARRYELQLSPATVRNVLADLEDAGYLQQPHTSAGRVPTDQGFRCFVDALVHAREATDADKAAVLARLSQLGPQDDLLAETGRLLGTLTGTAAVWNPPRPADARLSQLRFMPLREGELLAVLITQGGEVENRVVRVERDPSSQELERLHNYLASILGERTLIQLRDLVAEQAQRDRDTLSNRAVELVGATVGAASEEPIVEIEGQGRLLGQPDFADVEKMRNVLAALDEKEHLLSLLEGALASSGVQVLIGAEASLGEAEGLSVISAPYGAEGTPRGTLGLIAPTRIDYEKVVPLVGFAASTVGGILDGDGSPEDG